LNGPALVAPVALSKSLNLHSAGSQVAPCREGGDCRNFVKTKLVLFDIDGTLLTSGGAGEKALRLALGDRFGVESDLLKIQIAGRTDSGIARQIFAEQGIEGTPENLGKFFDGYLHHLARLLPETPGRLLPGILQLLDKMAALPQVALGLLTGNLQAGAKLKLTHYGVWEYFQFGAYADDHHDRNELGRFARNRAEELHGCVFQAEQIFILGDTAHDVACARAIGAKAVAIATGGCTSEELAKSNPDFLFEDLSDPDKVIAQLKL
jgi:phosphoglycolate phosphatase-like HAD superfamily hydrolase